MGHEVCYFAGDFETALTGVRKMESLGASVAFISTTFERAPELSTAIRRHNPSVVVISMSAGVQRGIFGNYRFDKPISDDDLKAMTDLRP